MVGDHPHWGGRGHGHWGPPHHAESDAGGYGVGYGGAGYRRKHHVPKCCRSKHKNKNVQKRCECAGHGGHGLEGYHFHEHGHGGHNDHDHDLKGPWAFGYDGFGDDWNDWDHNAHNFEHLQQLEHDSHQGHHEDGGCGYKKDCVSLKPDTLPAVPVGTAGGPAIISAGAGTVVGPATGPVVAAGAEPVVDAAAGPVLGPEVGPVIGPEGGPVLGPEVGPAFGPAGSPVLGPAGAPLLGPGPIIGPGVGPMIAPMGAPMAAAAAPFGVPPVSLIPISAPVAQPLPYRMCHDCRILKNGGSRCLCKTVKPHDATTDYDHHVYIDCDAATHNYPANNQLCYPRAQIPTPEAETTADARPKKHQGVVYPYVGYGPWSAYPWWGDWWGGHGNHGWGGENTGACGCGGGAGHGCSHENHATSCTECQHHGDHCDHTVDVPHGESIVHHAIPEEPSFRGYQF